MGLLISQHFYLSCFPVGPVDTFHSLPGSPKHSRVYWPGFAMIILCFKQTPKSVLLRAHTFSCLRICGLPRTPRAWLCWALHYSYVEFRSPRCDFSFGTSDHQGHVFFSWWKTGYQELSKVIQWHLNLPLASCLLRFHQPKQLECPDPTSRRGDGRTNICQTIQSARTKVKRQRRPCLVTTSLF